MESVSGSVSREKRDGDKFQLDWEPHGRSPVDETTCPHLAMDHLAMVHLAMDHLAMDHLAMVH